MIAFYMIMFVLPALIIGAAFVLAYRKKELD